MSNTELSAPYIHDMFCELMECEQWKRKDFKIISLDEKSFSERLIEEEMNNQNNVSSLYKYYNDGHVVLFVNDTGLQNNPFIASETIFSQLFEIYNQKIEYFNNINNMINNFKWMKSIMRGYGTWMDLQSSYMSYKLSIELFNDLSDGENPYEYNDFKNNILDVLKNIQSNNENKETKFSVIIFIIAKLAIYEESLNSNINNYFKLKKLNTLDMTEIIDGELGKLINDLYNIFIGSLLTNPTVLTFRKIDKITKKIINVLN